uniref:Uncharacterized protein n=1 Tax=Cucumis melo TaxID=3656 RepID=A0A9I9E4P4_CUCME
MKLVSETATRVEKWSLLVILFKEVEDKNHKSKISRKLHNHSQLGLELHMNIERRNGRIENSKLNGRPKQETVKTFMVALEMSLLKIYIKAHCCQDGPMKEEADSCRCSTEWQCQHLQLGDANI